MSFFLEQIRKKRLMRVEQFVLSSFSLSSLHAGRVMQPKGTCLLLCPSVLFLAISATLFLRISIIARFYKIRSLSFGRQLRRQSIPNDVQFSNPYSYVSILASTTLAYRAC